MTRRPLSGGVRAVPAGPAGGEGTGARYRARVTDVVLFLLVGGFAIFVGSLVQGAVGFGVAMVAAPVITMLDPGVMPGALQVVSLVLPLFSLAAEWRHVDWAGVGWALLGRLPGIVAGVWVLKAVPRHALGVVIGVMVLGAVVFSLRTVAVPRTPATIAAAGLLSGAAGTATSIGGPPMALVYQSARGPQARATMAMYFLIGVALSMTTLALEGEMPARAVWGGLLLVPFVVGGFLLSAPLRRFLDRAGRVGRFRAGVLLVATASAVLLIAQSLLG